MKEIIDYIIGFLIGVDLTENTAIKIGYTDNFGEFDNYDLVIKACGFFNNDVYGKEISLPTLPLKIWDEVPILYGEAFSEIIGNTIVLNADIIAGTYFLISRYEEMLRPKVRDVHGRFPGKESLPYKAGFIDRPIIEEWGLQLRTLLRENGFEIPEPPKKIHKVYLTHDLDQLAHFRTIRGMLGGVLRGIKRPKEGQKALKSFFGRVSDDPWYTFPFLFKLNNDLRAKIGKDKCESIIFVRSMGMKYKEDKPFPNLVLPDYKYLLRYCKRKDVTIGLHASYECGVYPERVQEEKTKLEKAIHNKLTYNRNHFLNHREPADFEQLISADIFHDFSMGYADVAGFRLGTCKNVKFINPHNKKLTKLFLHPITIMDGTLSDKRYMYMNAHDAYQYCEQLIKNVATFNGDLVLLWHNTSVEVRPDFYHRKLYKDILNLLQEQF
ncbi:MAG: polysaccharide deacetylase family protein [Paludibacter sp.]